jgi:ABC-type lipoprotein export system ATPase subunit
MFIKHLSFKFEKNQNSYFFKNLIVDFSPERIHFIQGENGIGKSTLFTILRGATDKKMAHLDAQIELDGTTYRAHDARLPHLFTQHVHTVQQNYDNMIANQFSVMENLQLANFSKFPGFRSLPPATLLDFSDALNIHKYTPAYLLSGGQRQLLAIIMALQKPTKVLLLDEPTATLDINNTQLVMHCLYRLVDQLKITVLIICHDKELVAKYSHGRNFVLRKDEAGERQLFKQ